MSYLLYSCIPMIFFYFLILPIICFILHIGIACSCILPHSHKYFSPHNNWIFSHIDLGEKCSSNQHLHNWLLSQLCHSQAKYNQSNSQNYFLLCVMWIIKPYTLHPCPTHNTTDILSKRQTLLFITDTSTTEPQCEYTFYTDLAWYIHRGTPVDEAASNLNILKSLFKM